MKNNSTFLKKFVIPNFPYVVIFWLADKAGQAFRLTAGKDVSQKVLNLQSGFAAAFENPLPSFVPQDLLVGLFGAVLFALALHMRKLNAKKFRKDEEYGSARWGKPEDIKPFLDANPDNNIILTKTEGLTMNPRPANPQYARNKNMLVIGGSGSGKTRFVLKPNLMQCRSKDYPVSFVVTDPKASILIECGRILRRHDYRIKVLNTINFKKSMHDDLLLCY